MVVAVDYDELFSCNEKIDVAVSLQHSLITNCGLTSGQILEYKDTGTYIMKIDESTLQQLDDHIVLSQAMSFSPFKKPFEDRIAKWEALLLLVSEVIDEWLMVQRQWMYLEPIFSSPDIQTQLPIESKRFQTVNNIWRKALAQAHLTPQILTMCSSKKLLEQFRESNRVRSSLLTSQNGHFSIYKFPHLSCSVFLCVGPNGL